MKTINPGHMGDAMDLYIEPAPAHPELVGMGAVVGFRRHGRLIAFGITPGPVVTLTAEQAKFIGENLLAASASAEIGLPAVIVDPAG